LLGGLPEDEMIISKDKQTSVRSPSVRTICPVSIDIDFEGEVFLLAKEKSAGEGPLQVLENLHGSLVVSDARVLKIL
jgi:hypothetical protein